MKKPLGDHELDLLRFVADHEPCTVRQVSDSYGAAAGLARTTVLTVMERLRGKGYLVRSNGEGAFLYRAAESKGEVMRDVVGQFVRRTLGGSVSPFVAFLAESDQLSDEEIQQLRDLIKRFEAENPSLV
ncbi:BlaI/MecI/CopY family transcriptional regulator [Fimbriimonas ginsengisoli]|uniref:Transcriptional regulator n=1 Tax=Fimbriimonas ginsengisoli Gsoil 348 TaxID=661478 RepID=A0A068NYS2_FIMGI|nr:BlaI/MecI/CopY family transcriptional regulator [Fimbriimonas ginsengisoli]AIE87319.1 transcriptional regulator [Fimbriimonas ginsengisoli Gsoil 348]